MNIAQIKAQISSQTGVDFPNLVMVRQFDQSEVPVPQPWLSHWDNDHRIRVSMHEDVFNRIKADPAQPGLGLKKEVVPATAERASYIRFVVITPAHIEATF